ncbi:MULTISPECIES: CpsD/CapB family tyrosine-protein kinase [Ruminococcus]|uniref:non-specific protein-tyrosine kinase n=1 Tax=Ruminococcus albus 8 TaxID=246199 RepID=E9SAU1_RUMAL|nr:MULTISPECIES: CpsD/CapB family tyrosine-protein kinase [Ruminococcus]EGC03626.1 capsular exopolysaccharide family [Ruminococcus albus 8]MBO5557509.1 CpsD/CapB family tyrosine-protein kinase [Ruminococcus sp.]MCC3349911.1 CpsD/CapB family tyrosine-protein kinase [Ruminococcus albus 8]
MASIKKNQSSNTRTRRRTLMDKSVAFPVTEAYKNLRTNLSFALSTKKNHIIAISSALAAEGKSTVAANIAITLAQNNNSVLLIDGDLRKPVQHKVFNIKNEVGISSLIGGLNSFKEVVHADVIENLDVVTCGPIPPNPSELMGSDNMKMLLEQLAAHYDYIIIDTPPINIVTDALTLLDTIAGVLLVAKHGQSTYDALEEAIEAVRMADGSLLGVVINNVSVTGGKYGGKYSYKYKYGYKYGYGYGYGYSYGNNASVGSGKSNDNDE